MIAIALGTLLLLGLVQIFGGVRASFGSAEALARVQENSRFAMDFLRRDVRMAAHFGCRSEYQVVAVPGRRAFYNHTATNTGGTLANDDTAPYPLWLHRPLEVYDYSANGGTSPGNTYTAALAEFPAGETLATNYTPDLPAFLATTGNGLGTDGLRGNDVGDLVPGSDVVVVRYLNENSVTLSGGLTHADGVLVGASAADFPNRRLFAITDCNAVSLFQITATTPQVVSKADGTNNLNRMVWGAVDAEPQYGVQTAVHGYEFAVYYVGRTGADTPPALFRRRLLPRISAPPKSWCLAWR
jgi:type IV pilus assembly protein PilW